MTTVKDENGTDLDIKDAILGHARFSEEFNRDRAFYENLASKKQTPRLLWIGCADSRVVPTQIINADPGELFEIRNIANIVPPAGAPDSDAVGAAIEYGVGHLGIDDIIVCGHTNCGGVAALADGAGPDPSGHLGRWVAFTQPAHRLIEAARVPEPERMRATVQAHVQFQIDNLLTYPIVLDGVAAGTLSIHGWIYDMETGVLLGYDSISGEWRALSEMAQMDGAV